MIKFNNIISIGIVSLIVFGAIGCQEDLSDNNINPNPDTVSTSDGGGMPPAEEDDSGDDESDDNGSDDNSDEQELIIDSLMRLEVESGTVVTGEQPSDVDSEFAIRFLENTNASNDTIMGYINYVNSGVDIPFEAPHDTTYLFHVAAASGHSDASTQVSHSISIDGENSKQVDYDTLGWGNFNEYPVEYDLSAGEHTINLRYNGTFAELDYVDVSIKTGSAQ